ncbi:integrin beta-1-A-like isoform X2 [Lytechinus pictus]|uniref:integrin beta-1-A-like isoform X2 n=1 Tax=Lytechinus pictus TaxID=7653 RepID=UPI0030B9C2F0
MASVRLPHRTMRLETSLFFLLTFVLGIFTVHSNEALSSMCNGAQTCGECISVNPECTWCTQATFEGRRCDLENVLQDAGCTNITNPVASKVATQNDPLTEPNTNTNPEDIVQVKPQRMKIQVRPKEPITIQLYVRQAEDYPVDLYYAMDLSHSMKDDLNALKGLATTLSQELSSITTDFQLGFGSFVDKTVLPYVSTVPARLISPCSGCASPHGFHNVLPLNDNSTLFASRIQSTTVSGNLDTPEGGFDALMQIAVCKDAIGWRDKARHLVIFTTDASFHFAGDGRLGGIVEPNDGQCHMDSSTNMYSYSTLQDYPSIGHLSAKLRENNVIPIFAVTSDQTQLYANLQTYIEGATVGTLDSDSGNVVELIRDNYNQITSQVRLTSTAPDDVTLSYRANCIHETVEDSSECSGLQLGDTVSFDITITAERCLEGGMTSFDIGPVGFSEQLQIELEVTCECDCQDIREMNSPDCSGGNGTLICGECECNQGRYGSKCECSGNEINMDSTDPSPCRTDNTTRTCSGRGECICGKCVCDNTGNPGEVISGQFCECDNFNCPYSRGLRCGGPDQGTCVCDIATRQPKCECKSGYEGDSCDCPTRKDMCRASNGLECNAHGTCVCGACECFADSQFQGKTCEKCPTCPLGICHIHRDCVECTVFQSGRLTPEQCSMCNFNIVNVTSIEEYTNDNLKCSFDFNNSCTFDFVVVKENETLTVYVNQEESCIVPVKGPILTGEEIRWIVIGIILGIVLIGMILVFAWRLYTYVQDKREYAQWENECKKAQWDQRKNPLFQSSSTRFENPMFGQ